MTDTQITVRYSRRLGDGNLGSEECSLEWSGPHDSSYGDVAAALRVQVLAFLSRSGAPEVAWKAQHELSPTQPPDGVPVGASTDDDQDQVELPF